MLFSQKSLKCGFTVAQTKKGLSEAWIGYRIAKNNEQHERMKYYASGIHKLQRELVDAGIMCSQYLTEFLNIDINETRNRS